MRIILLFIPFILSHNLFGQLNNTAVNDTTYGSSLCFDCYNHKKQSAYGGQTVFYNDTTSEIVICYDSGNHKAFDCLAEKIRNAKKLTLVGLITQKGVIVISSFDLYIVKGGATSLVSNVGSKFNDELLKLVKTIEPGDSVIFDQVRVQGPDGALRTIQAPGFIVK